MSYLVRLLRGSCMNGLSLPRVAASMAVSAEFSVQGSIGTLTSKYGRGIGNSVWSRLRAICAKPLASKWAESIKVTSFAFSIRRACISPFSSFSSNQSFESSTSFSQAAEIRSAISSARSLAWIGCRIVATVSSVVDLGTCLWPPSVLGGGKQTATIASLSQIMDRHPDRGKGNHSARMRPPNWRYARLAAKTSPGVYPRPLPSRQVQRRTLVLRTDYAIPCAARLRAAGA